VVTSGKKPESVFMPKIKKQSEMKMQRDFHINIGDFVQDGVEEGLTPQFIIMELELMKLNVWTHLLSSIAHDNFENTESKSKKEGDNIGYG